MSVSSTHNARPHAPDGDAPSFADVRRAAALEKLAALQDMAMDFAVWLHAEGAAAMEAAKDAEVRDVEAQDVEAQDVEVRDAEAGNGARGNGGRGTGAAEKVARLSNAFNKAARAARQAIVLEHEIAGLRPQPGARAAASASHAAGANQNAGPNDTDRRPRMDWARNGSTPSGLGGGFDDYGRDYADYSAAEGEAHRWRREALGQQIQRLAEAVDRDLVAAGLADKRRQSAFTKITKLVQTVPHPAFDAALAATDAGLRATVLEAMGVAPDGPPRERGPPS